MKTLNDIKGEKIIGLQLKQQYGEGDEEFNYVDSTYFETKMKIRKGKVYLKEIRFIKFGVKS